MSDYGARVRNPADLSTWWDSRYATAGVTMDFLRIAAGQAGFTKIYPGFAGRDAKLVSMDSFGAVGGASLDFALGYPRLTVTQASYPRAYMAVAL